MRRGIRSAALVLGAALLVAATPSRGATPGLGLPFDEDEQAPCDLVETFVPGAVGTDHVLGPELTLRVKVVVDTGSGITTATASKYLGKDPQLAYDGVNVKLRLSYGTMNLGVGTGQIDGNDAMDRLKSAHGGQRPGGVDLVYLLTAADLTSGTTGSGLAGRADCIGGIRYPQFAFAIGEVSKYDANEASLLRSPKSTAKIFAHEIGHLLGAHHHYANCAERSTADALQPGEASYVCSLMINDVGLASLNFSTVNDAVVRGHVSEFSRDGQSRG